MQGRIVMWVIANGTPKAGSTWLVQLLEATGRFERVPSALQAEGWRNSSVADGEIASATRELSTASTRYLSKQHWADKHEELLEVPGVKVLNIVRDIRDLVISRYHHNVRAVGEKLPLEGFVFKKGRKYVRDYCAYHRHWIAAADVGSTSYYVSSYEFLSHDLVTAASELYDFVGVPLTAEESVKSAQSTVFSKKRNTGPGNFFRKGKALAFGDEIGEDENAFLLKCAREFDLGNIKRDIGNRYPTLVPYLRITDVGLGDPG